VVSRFAITHKRFRVAPRGRRGGAAFSFRLSEAARVRIGIARQVKRRGRSRYAGQGSLRPSRLPRGPARVFFGGRLGGRALAPGAYRATISATDGAGNGSSPRRISFRIVRR
jgi:hypothetical protein